MANPAISPPSRTIPPLSHSRRMPPPSGVVTPEPRPLRCAARSRGRFEAHLRAKPPHCQAVAARSVARSCTVRATLDAYNVDSPSRGWAAHGHRGGLSLQPRDELRDALE